MLPIARTATGMNKTLHTDFRKSETSRDIKKSDFQILNCRVSHKYLDDFMVTYNKKNFNSSEQFMQLPLKVNKEYFL